MKNITSSKLPSILAVAGLVTTLGTGCASRTVQFDVVRPAIMNLQPSGNTLSVGTIAANGRPQAAAEVSGELQYRIAHSLNPSIRLLSSGAAPIEVDGAVLADTYSEHTETVSQTCSRTVDDGTDANGNAQSHTETYDCSYDITVGDGTSQLRLRVVTADDHRVLLDQIYTRSASVNSPSKADAAQLMHRVRMDAVDQFAKVILPWRDTVAERFKDCDGDDRCKKGIELVKAGNLSGAEASFSQVIGSYDTGGFVLDKDTQRIGEAFYDRAVVRAHLDLYGDAVTDLQKALKLQPKRAKWPQELASIQQMARDRQALREQGAAP
jgi:hypothetical protein